MKKKDNFLLKIRYKKTKIVACFFVKTFFLMFIKLCSIFSFTNKLNIYLYSTSLVIKFSIIIFISDEWQVKLFTVKAKVKVRPEFVLTKPA